MQVDECVVELYAVYTKKNTKHVQVTQHKHLLYILRGETYPIEQKN